VQRVLLLGLLVASRRASCILLWRCRLRGLLNQASVVPDPIQSPRSSSREDTTASQIRQPQTVSSPLNLAMISSSGCLHLLGCANGFMEAHVLAANINRKRVLVRPHSEPSERDPVPARKTPILPHLLPQLVNYRLFPFLLRMRWTATSQEKLA